MNHRTRRIRGQSEEDLKLEERKSRMKAESIQANSKIARYNKALRDAEELKQEELKARLALRAAEPEPVIGIEDEPAAEMKRTLQDPFHASDSGTRQNPTYRRW